MEEFKHILDSDAKKALSDLAKATFSSFFERGLKINNFIQTGVNLQFNSLTEKQREILANNLLTAIKENNHLSEEEESFLKERFEFLCSGRVGDTMDIH